RRDYPHRCKAVDPGRESPRERAPKEQPLPGTSQAPGPPGRGNAGEQVPRAPHRRGKPASAGESLRYRDSGGATWPRKWPIGCSRPQDLQMTTLSELESPDAFVRRHIGPDATEQHDTLEAIGCTSLD